MKACLFETHTRIEPFGEDVGKAFLGGTSMGVAVERALIQNDIPVNRVTNTSEINDKNDVLLLPDTLFITRAVVQDFVAACGDHGVWRLALAKSPLTAYTRPLQQLEEDETCFYYNLFCARGVDLPTGLGWNEVLPLLQRQAQPILVNPRFEIERIPQTRPGPPRMNQEIPRSMFLIAEVRAWVHILWLNQLLPWIRLREQWQDLPAWRRYWRSRGRSRYLQGRRLSLIGKHADIHPTAYVEGSILGEGVSLGACTFVRDSIIGDGVSIGDRSRFSRCVVGERCHTLNDSSFIACTCYPESSLANVMLRNSVIGRRVFLTSGVIFQDEGITAPVTVRHLGQEQQTGRWMLGGCAGHDAMLGTRAIFLPGRTVPNQTMVVMRPEEGVTRFPAKVEPFDPHVYHQGSIRPNREVLPDWKALEIE